MCSETEVLTAGFNGALLPVRLHFAVNFDRSWTVILISLDIYTETCFLLSPPLFPPFHFPALSLSLTVSDCDRLPQSPMIYDELHNSATSRRCLYKAPLRTDNASFHCSEKDRKTVRCSPFEAVVGGLWQGGLFITSVLCMGLWDDVLSVLDDCY